MKGSTINITIFSADKVEMVSETLTIEEGSTTIELYIPDLEVREKIANNLLLSVQAERDNK